MWKKPSSSLLRTRDPSSGPKTFFLLNKRVQLPSWGKKGKSVTQKVNWLGGDICESLRGYQFQPLVPEVGKFTCQHFLANHPETQTPFDAHFPEISLGRCEFKRSLWGSGFSDFTWHANHKKSQSNKDILFTYITVYLLLQYPEQHIQHVNPNAQHETWHFWSKTSRRPHGSHPPINCSSFRQLVGSRDKDGCTSNVRVPMVFSWCSLHCLGDTNYIKGLLWGFPIGLRW